MEKRRGIPWACRSGEVFSFPKQPHETLAIDSASTEQRSRKSRGPPTPDLSPWEDALMPRNAGFTTQAAGGYTTMSVGNQDADGRNEVAGHKA